MIEALACGTPVIAWDCGSVREVIDPGITGFIVSSEEQAMQAVRRAADLNRERIRAVFERRFSAKSMAKAYVRVYEQVRNKSSHPGREYVRVVS